MSKPLITVGLPVYNGADYIEAAIQSVLGQSFGDFELLISEGGSTDATREIVERYAALDPRIRYERTEHRLAQVPNCNRVVELARTEWVQFLCHDDILFPWALREIHDACQGAGPDVAIVAHQSPNFFHSQYVAIDGAVMRQGDVRAPAFPGRRVLVKGSEATRSILGLGASPSLPSLTSAAVRRAALLGLGGFDGRYAQFDTRAWNRLLLRHDLIQATEVLSLTRIHANQVTTKLSGTPRTVTEAGMFWREWVEEARRCGHPIPFAGRWLPWLKSSMEGAGQAWACHVRSGFLAAARMLCGMGVATGFGALLLLPRAAFQDKARKRGVPDAYQYLHGRS